MKTGQNCTCGHLGAVSHDRFICTENWTCRHIWVTTRWSLMTGSFVLKTVGAREKWSLKTGGLS